MTKPPSPTVPRAAPVPFRRVALIGRHASPGIAAPLARLAALLVAGGRDVVIEAETARNAELAGFASAPPASLGRHADVAIVVGGDGTMLAIARHLAIDLWRLATLRCTAADLKLR